VSHGEGLAERGKMKQNTLKFQSPPNRVIKKCPAGDGSVQENGGEGCRRKEMEKLRGETQVRVPHKVRIDTTTTVILNRRSLHYVRLSVGKRGLGV